MFLGAEIDTSEEHELVTQGAVLLQFGSSTKFLLNTQLKKQSLAFPPKNVNKKKVEEKLGLSPSVPNKHTNTRLVATFIASLSLENVPEIIESNLQLNTTLSTKPQH